MDDDGDLTKTLRLALEIKGFQVALASDGELAVEFLEQERPDLILTDIKMPRMDGLALLRVVKQPPEWRDIPFVFMTGTAGQQEAAMAESMGADEYIVKPFALKDLVKAIRQLTNGRGCVSGQAASPTSGGTRWLPIESA